MHKEKHFISGCEKNGLKKRKATQLFDEIEKFAGYGLIKVTQLHMQ